MIKEQSYREKFILLEPWVEQIFAAIKKEIRNDHLRRNSLFISKYFNKKSIDKISNIEIQSVYLNEILENNEELGEWISSRWMLKHGEIYQFFAQELSKINPNFEQISAIPETEGLLLMRASIGQFGAVETYIFSIINAVSFSESILQLLRNEALQEKKQITEPSQEVHGSLEEIKEKYEKEIARLQDRYEKKVAGMFRKYQDDVEGFKKQIKQLQRKLQDVSR